MVLKILITQESSLVCGMIKRSLEEIFSDIQVDVLPVKNSSDVTSGGYDLLIAGKPWQQNTLGWRYDNEAEAVPLFLLLDHREKDSLRKQDFAGYNLKEVFVKPFEPRSLADELLKLYPYVKLRPNIQKPLADFNALDFEVFSVFKKQTDKDVHSDIHGDLADGKAAQDLKSDSAGVFAADYDFTPSEPATQKPDQVSMSDAWSLKLDEKGRLKDSEDKTTVPSDGDSVRKPLSVVDNDLKPLKEPLKLKDYGQKLFDQITSNIFTSSDDKKEGLNAKQSATASENRSISEQLGSYFSEAKPSPTEQESSNEAIDTTLKFGSAEMSSKDKSFEEKPAAQFSTSNFSTSNKQQSASLDPDAHEPADDSWGKGWHHPFDREEAKEGDSEGQLRGYETAAGNPRLEVQNLVAFFTDKKPVSLATDLSSAREGQAEDHQVGHQSTQSEQGGQTTEVRTTQIRTSKANSLKQEEQLAAFLIDQEPPAGQSSARLRDSFPSASDQADEDETAEQFSPEQVVARKKHLKTQEAEKNKESIHNLAEVDFSRPQKALADKLSEVKERSLSEKESSLMFDKFDFEKDPPVEEQPWSYQDSNTQDLANQANIQLEDDLGPAQQKTDPLTSWQQATEEADADFDQQIAKVTEELFPDFASTVDKSKAAASKSEPSVSAEESFGQNFNYTDEEELLEKSQPLQTAGDLDRSSSHQASLNGGSDQPRQASQRQSSHQEDEKQVYDSGDEVLDTIPAGFDLDFARLQGSEGALAKEKQEGSGKIDDSLMDVALNFYVDPTEHQASNDYDQMLQDIMTPKATEAQNERKVSFEQGANSSPLREKFDSEVQQLKTDLATTFPAKERRASEKAAAEASSADLIDQFENFKENPPSADEDAHFDPATMGVASNDLATVLDWKKDPSVPIPPSLKKEDVIRHLKSLQQQDPKIDAKKAAEYLRMIEEHIKQAEEHSRISKMMLKEFQSLEHS